MEILGMVGGLQMTIIALIVLVVPIVALIDILRNEFTENNKLIWILVVILLPLFGAILYLIIGSGQKIRK